MFVSALIADGPPSRVLEEAIDGRVDLVLDELQRVLTGKLGFSDERAGAARDLLAGLATARPWPPRSVETITGDPVDDAILACAVDAGVDVLATGDRKHLLPIGVHHGVRLLTPQATLAQLHARE